MYIPNNNIYIKIIKIYNNKFYITIIIEIEATIAKT